MKDQFDAIFAISGSDFNKFWQTCLPENRCMDKYDPRWIKALINKMETANEGLDRDDPKVQKVLLILDDLATDRKNWNADDTIRQLATKGRHRHISIILSSQYYYLFPPVFRSNVDYLLVGKTDARSIKLISESHVIPPLKKDDLVELLEKYAGTDYGFLLIDSGVSVSNNPSDIYSIIRAPNPSKK